MGHRKIYAIGETVLDIVFKNHQPVAAKAGGSMLNTCVSLGRLGLPVHFISEVGMDKAGHFITGFLKDNGVNTQYIHCYQEGKTALALAFLDENNNASYDFYKQYPENRMDIVPPQFNKDDILIFGSFFAITHKIREMLLKILENASTHDAIIMYDPNFRRPHLHELESVKPLIRENIRYATIIRGSDEDFHYIYNAQDVKKAFRLINGDKILIYTCSKKEVYLHTPRLFDKYPVVPIDPVSTIGAGDTFNAGIIYALYKNKITQDAISLLSPDDWKGIIHPAMDFASEVCLSFDNYISHVYANQYKP